MPDSCHLCATQNLRSYVDTVSVSGKGRGNIHTEASHWNEWLREAMGSFSWESFMNCVSPHLVGPKKQEELTQ